MENRVSLVSGIKFILGGIQMRELSNTFISDLKSGVLKDILLYVLNDNTVDIEIRKNYINIYYRGGNILKISEIRKSLYAYNYDDKYLPSSSSILRKYKSTRDWNNYFPMMKQAMDFYFSKHKKQEREYQQLIVRENNYSSLANSTDYFIIDIEYDNHANARFDLIAVEWPSETSKRKLSQHFEPKLVIIEMKYGDKALSGNAGVKKHYDDFALFVSNSSTLSDFKIEMLGVLKQKRELGLIPCLSDKKNKNPIVKFAETVDLAFIIVNHDPASTKLTAEISTYVKIPVKFIVSNFMGYGIYSHSIYKLNEFKERYKNQFIEL